MAKCAECNKELGMWLTPVEFEEGFTLCFPCSTKPYVLEKHKPQSSSAKGAPVANETLSIDPIPDVTLTTETYLGDMVTQRLGVIASECVLGVNVLRDFKSAFTNIIGGRSAGLQHSLKEAKEIVFKELKIEAHNLGANAVIGIDLDYQELNGKGGDMLMLVASGTAVTLEQGQ